MQGNQQASAAESTESGGRLGLDNADDAQFFLARDDRKSASAAVLVTGGCIAPTPLGRKGFALRVAHD